MEEGWGWWEALEEKTVSSINMTDWRTLHRAGFNRGTGNRQNETVN